MSAECVVYRYAWGNNERRAELKGRLCVIEATGTMQTALVRFLDNGARVTTSLRALRAVMQDGQVLVTEPDGRHLDSMRHSGMIAP